ncbi:hypothetical protein Peur_024860 [Populus x canadensis]
MEFEKQQNDLDCTTLLLAILDSEETELQEKALVFQANSCMGRSKTTSHDDLGVMHFEDTTQKSSSIAVRPLDFFHRSTFQLLKSFELIPPDCFSKENYLKKALHKFRSA